MPTSILIGQAGPANDKVGGVPKVHYFDFFSKGGGQVVRLLFLDAGVAFIDIRYSFEEFFRDIRPAFMAPRGLDQTGNLPVLELNEEVMTQSYPILRHSSRVLDNVYDGDTEAEMFWVDRICDIVIDWRIRFVDSYLSSNQEDYTRYCAHDRPCCLNALERLLTENQYAKEGPYVYGLKFTYADLVLFQVLHDEKLGKRDMRELQNYPRLRQVTEAVRNRTNVKAFLESKEYNRGSCLKVPLSNPLHLQYLGLNKPHLRLGLP